MKILRVHNEYQQEGGEAAVERAERDLLVKAGHDVVAYERHNDEIALYTPWRRATLPARTVWAWDSQRALRALIARERPDVAHFTNTFPLISPAAYAACREAGVPVVQSLHNYRLLCPAATFLREGRVCEDCVERSLWQSVRHACYRGSRGATAAAAAMLAAHRGLGTWRRDVDVYVALTEFARRKFADSGLPAERIAVKPNFVAPDPGAREESGEYALFAGRLAPEKGIATLLRAWQRLGGRVPLRIAGDGPLREPLEREIVRSGVRGVRVLGRLPRNPLLDAVKGARFLVFPSTWYEGFPLAIAEAFACGVPVVASRLGAMREIIAHERTGLLVRPDDPDALAAAVEAAWAEPKRSDEWGRNARAEYEAKYTAERNAALLLAIYERARRGVGGSPIEASAAVLRPDRSE